jgi:hypothetical protein
MNEKGVRTLFLLGGCGGAGKAPSAFAGGGPPPLLR